MNIHTPSTSEFLQDKDHEVISMREAEFAVRDVVISTSFNGLSALIDFLWFVCSKTLRGQAATITKHMIATEVLRRPRVFDVAEYSLVEDVARDVRERIEHYYENDGKFDKVRILLPDDSFVPQFVRHSGMEDSAHSKQIADFANRWLNEDVDASHHSANVDAFQAALD